VTQDRVVVVAGRPSVGRLALCLVAAAGLMTIGFSLACVIATAHEVSSPWESLGLAAGMVIFWAPATCWSAWYFSVPAVLITGVVLAVVTHRYRPPERTAPPVGNSRWRRVGVVCLVVLLTCGVWTIVLGVFALGVAAGA
jgi:hypothetical protein